MARLCSLFDRWINLAKVEKDYESPLGLVIAEQVMKSSQPWLVQFLIERKRESLSEKAKIADRFLEALESANSNDIRIKQLYFTQK